MELEEKKLKTVAHHRLEAEAWRALAAMPGLSEKSRANMEALAAANERAAARLAAAEAFPGGGAPPATVRC